MWTRLGSVRIIRSLMEPTRSNYSIYGEQGNGDVSKKVQLSRRWPLASSNSLVIPHLEVASSVLNPYLQDDIRIL